LNLSGTRSLVISRSLRREVYKKDSVIFYEGSQSDKLFLIGNGKVKVSSGGKFLRILEEGDFFGEIGLSSKTKGALLFTQW
jgi:CRP-like cAMP-binding protein